MSSAVVEANIPVNANERNANAYPGFVQNPYNTIGMKHNDALDMLMSLPSANENTFNQFISDIDVKLQQYPLITVNSNFLKDEAIKLRGYMYKEANGEFVLNPDFANFITGNQLLKGVITAYFVEMQATDNVHLRISKSKQAELYVKNNISASELGGEVEKTKLLTSMSIYRYSTHYWNVENEQDERPIWDFVDAIVAFYMENYQTDPWAIPSEEEIAVCSGIASAVSFIGWLSGI